MKRRRDLESTTLSFLDAICCGFGSMILLLIITKISEPAVLEEGEPDEGLIARYEQELAEILGETERLEREEKSTTEDLEIDEKRVADLERELVRIRSEMLKERDDAAFSNDLQGRLAQARQSLTEEMQRLFAQQRPPIEDYKVGGIPVDSEYIIFLVDTSGSMQRAAWPEVQEQIAQTLQVYPTVKGIQIMNDEGAYMFASYAGRWMNDTPATRQAIVDGMRNWTDYSDSSPREGILEALETFANDPDDPKKISFYVYSDDFQRGSISAVVREIDRANRADAEGNRRVRIHAVAFPTFWEEYGRLESATGFAVLMRAICQRNGGTFVALPVTRR